MILLNFTHRCTRRAILEDDKGWGNKKILSKIKALELYYTL